MKTSTIHINCLKVYNVIVVKACASFSSLLLSSFRLIVSFFFPFFRFLSFCFSVRREGSTTGLFSYAFPSKNNIALAITTNAQ